MIHFRNIWTPPSSPDFQAALWRASISPQGCANVVGGHRTFSAFQLNG